MAGSVAGHDGEGAACAARGEGAKRHGARRGHAVRVKCVFDPVFLRPRSVAVGYRPAWVTNLVAKYASMASEPPSEP